MDDRLACEEFAVEQNTLDCCRTRLEGLSQKTVAERLHRLDWLATLRVNGGAVAAPALQFEVPEGAVKFDLSPAEIAAVLADTRCALRLLRRLWLPVFSPPSLLGAGIACAPCLERRCRPSPAATRSRPWTTWWSRST